MSIFSKIWGIIFIQILRFMDLRAYEWIVGLGGLLAVTTAYGIGANDVANAFAFQSVRVLFQ